MTEEIIEYMREQGLGRSDADFLQLWAMFHNKSLQILDSVVGHSKSTVVLWTSHLTTPETIEKYLDKDRYVSRKQHFKICVFQSLCLVLDSLFNPGCLR